MTRYLGMITVCAMLTACGGSTAAPSTGSAAFTLTAAPNPITGASCQGCGAQSTDREAVTNLTIQETGGVGGTVTGIDVALREAGTTTLIGTSGTFDSAAVASLAGSSRLAANGTLVVRSVGTHYARELAGKSATLTLTVHVADDRGNQVSRDLAVPVSAT